ncbi:MAG: IS66-like element accessory protein TnpA [Dongiaceae bacterium]
MSGYAQEKSFAVVAEARRKWTATEKRAVVAETEATSVSSVARRHGISSSLVFRWRRELGLGRGAAKPAAGFVPALLPPPAGGALPILALGAGVIEIMLASGHRVRVDGAVDASALKRVLAVLDGR